MSDNKQENEEKMNNNVRQNIIHCTENVYDWKQCQKLNAILDYNYLIFFDSRITEVKYTQVHTTLTHNTLPQYSFHNIQSCIDLTTIQRYSIEINGNSNYDLKLFPYKNYGGRKHFEFGENDKIFKCRIIDILTANNTLLIQNAIIESNINNNNEGTNISKNVGEDVQISDKIKDKERVFFSTLFLVHPNENSPSTPFFCVLRNKKLEIFNDYQNYISGEPFKSLEVLSLFSNVRGCMYADKFGFALVPKSDENKENSISNCALDHGLQEIENKEREYSCVECWNKFNTKMHGCHECSYYVCSDCRMISNETYFISISNNERSEWLLHLQFLFAFGIMRNDINSTLEDSGVKAILEERSNKEMKTGGDNDGSKDGNGDGNEDGTKDEDDVVTDVILNFLELRKEQVFNVFAKDFNDDKAILAMVDQICQKWRESDDDNFSLSMIWDALKIDITFVVECYSRTVSKKTKKKRKDMCEYGLECTAFNHYMRDRSGREIHNDTNVNNNGNNDAMKNALMASVEENIVDVADKIHSFLFAHAMDEGLFDDDEEEEEEKVNAQVEQQPVEQVDEQANEQIDEENDNQTVGRNVGRSDDQTVERPNEEINDDENEEIDGEENIGRNVGRTEGRDEEEDRDILYPKKAQPEMKINIDKFVITVKGNFGFGDACAYWYYDKHNVSYFCAPASNSLFSEVCENKNIPLKYCLEPINYWCVYFHACTLRKAFSNQFKSCNLQSLNLICNIEFGSLMSTNHYLCLLLYSDWTTFQNQFKRNTRRMNADETDDEFYIRNAYVAHWQRYLIECVYFFGRQLSSSHIIYCGISIPLLFNSYEKTFWAPLSTTTSDRIGLQFAGAKGIVLKMKRANEDSRYFPLEKFSHYSHEKEWFVCDTRLKIVDIVFQSSATTAMFSSKKYIRAILLLEKVVKGYLFVDVGGRDLVSKRNVQMLMNLMDSHEKGGIINYSEETAEDNVFPKEFLSYMQDLFNHRVKRFSQLKLDSNNDKMGSNQTWINGSELDRIECLPLKEHLLNFLQNNSVNEINFTPKPVRFMVVDEILQEFKDLKVGLKMMIGDIFLIEKNGMVFEWKVEVMRVDPSHPKKCKIFLNLHKMPKECNMLIVSFDVVSAEMKFERVNKWKHYKKVGAYASFSFILNEDLKKNVDGFSVCVCGRTLFC